MLKANVGVSSDYAIAEGGDFRFYYGYEETNDQGDWLFKAWQKQALIMAYTAKDLGAEQFDKPGDVLLKGIARYFALCKGK